MRMRERPRSISRSRDRALHEVAICRVKPRALRAFSRTLARKAAQSEGVLWSRGRFEANVLRTSRRKLHRLRRPRTRYRPSRNELHRLHHVRTRTVPRWRIAAHAFASYVVSPYG